MLRREWLYLGFLIYYIFSIVLSDNKEVIEILRKLELICVFVLFKMCVFKNQEIVSKLLHFFWFVALLSIPYTVFDYGEGKVYGSNVGYILAYFIPYWATRNKSNFLILTIIGIILSLKRGPILIATIGTLYYYKSIFKQITIISAVAYFYLINTPGLGKLIEAVIESRTEDFTGSISNVGSGRGGIYGWITNEMLDWQNLARTLIGARYAGAQTLIENRLGTRLRVHSDFLELTFDYGVTFLVFLMIFIWACWYNTRGNRSVTFHLLIFIIQSAISFTFTSNYMLIWFMILTQISVHEDKIRSVPTN